MDIRRAIPEDVEALTDLVVQLGYSGTTDDIARRLTSLANTRSDDVFVAVEGGRVAGFVHVSIVRTLENDAYSEIRGLVVDDRLRNRGVGNALVASAEEWARQRGLRRMRVRSNVTRDRARKFYEREGYVVTKVSNIFDKAL